LFLCLLADIEAHRGRGDSATELLHRARRVAATTGEHASDRMIDERLAMSLQPAIVSSGLGGVAG
jgi:hypothetical protein